MISLPPGTKDVPLGAVEVKAAWKVLSDAERHSGRFHTVQALLGGASLRSPWALVGFHVFVVNGVQGAWATFAQMDNAPSGKPATSGSSTSSIRTAKHPIGQTVPGQCQGRRSGTSLQMTPDADAATKLNTYMHYILRQADAKHPGNTTI